MQYIVHNTDVDRDITVGRNALLQGLNRHYENNAQVTMHMDEYSKNAVKINVLHSANAKKEGSALRSQGYNTSLPFTVKISDILDIVNEINSDILPESVAEHYGNERHRP